ncbi:MAG: SPOR domain-containing protein [Bacteroidales bacterium]|nr:SPOR domain-containing protein [Bacteroidales bacterium]
MRISTILCVVAALTIATSCASTKGSSSLDDSPATTSTSRKPRPKIKAEATTPKRETTSTAAQIKAQKAAEAESARMKAEAEARAKAIQDSIAAAEEAALKAAAEVITMREEQVKVVSTYEKAQRGSFHIIIGSFRNVQNAENLCKNAADKGFSPSIMQNEEGMYRVAVVSLNDEQSARDRIAELRAQQTQWVGMWLLVEKK